MNTNEDIRFMKAVLELIGLHPTMMDCNSVLTKTGISRLPVVLKRLVTTLCTVAKHAKDL